MLRWRCCNSFSASLQCVHMGDRAAIALPRMPVLPRLLFAILAACGTSIAASTCSSKEGHGSCTASPPTSQPYILVVGSINVDITMQVTRLPHHGETITARSPSTATAVGGKGANTAVAAAKLLNNTATGQHRHASAFICQFGNDAHAAWLQSVLLEHGVDVSGSGHSTELPSGQGIVMLEEDGSVSSVVRSAWGGDTWHVDAMQPRNKA